MKRAKKSSRNEPAGTRKTDYVSNAAYTDEKKRKK
jgi:hypothetical protein